MVAKQPTTPEVTEFEPTAKAKRPSRAKTPPATVVVPTFAELGIKLAAAELTAKAASADAGAARAERSTVAVDAILAAYTEALAVDDVRSTLLDAGIIKGTVSKITTILSALGAGKITTADIKSLNGAYNAVKEIEKIAAGAKPGSTATSTGTPYSAPVEPVVATSPDEAFKIIIDSIKSITDADEAWKVGGEWITKITNEISATLKAKDDGVEDEEGE